MKPQCGRRVRSAASEAKKVLGPEGRAGLRLRVELIAVIPLTVLLRQKMYVMVAVFFSCVKAKYSTHPRNPTKNGDGLNYLWSQYVICHFIFSFKS